jgi:ATP-binding protein involved in chromosome partitioning
MFKLAVLSGKGGVGKTTITVNLAYAFRDLGKKVGIVDLDLTGPNVVRALNIDSLTVSIDAAEVKYIPIEHDGMKVISMASVIPEDQPLLLKGADSDSLTYTREAIIREFATRVNWGNIDILVMDCPPGTVDEVTSGLRYFKPDGAVVVTTPHSMAYVDYVRVVKMLKDYDIPILKTVVNMAYFDAECPHLTCKEKYHRYKIFYDKDIKYENAYELPIKQEIASTHRVDLKELATIILSGIKEVVKQ